MFETSMNDKAMNLKLKRLEVIKLLVACTCPSENEANKWSKIHDKLKEMLKAFDEKERLLKGENQMKYALIPVTKTIPVHYTNDPLEAVTLFVAYACGGIAITLSRQHEGEEKPTDYYDVIVQANM